jgi:hypothetical protein
MTHYESDLDAYMTIACAIAVEDAKTMPVTPDLARRAHVIAEAARDQLAATRRAERARRPSNVVSGAIRAAIQAMSPAQVLARLTELHALHPGVQFAHRHFEQLAEDDFRSALEDLESLVERGA